MIVGTRRTAIASLAAASALTLAACDFGDVEVTDPTARPTADAGGESQATAASAGHVDNPFAGAEMYVNGTWSDHVLATAEATEDTALADDMRAVAYTPTAVWMDRISAIDGNAAGPGLRHHLDAAVEQAADADGPVVITVVVYNLPGRDCFALASNGELPASDAGLERYRAEYVDVIASMLAEDAYADLRIVTIIEPDSLPNLVTNADYPACQEADAYYRDGVAYALDAFAPLENVYAYIDAAHSGWLGWDTNAAPSAQLFAEVVQSTQAGFGAVDGFVTNTANYTPLEEPYLPDPDLQVGGQPVKSGSFYEFNPVFDEADWAADLHARLVAAGFPSQIGMLIDTSRNGWGGEERPQGAGGASSVDGYVDQSKVDRRGHRGAWCNQDGAGLGRLPQALPAGYGDHLDALLWVKPPGESDGSSREIDNDEGKGFDRMCDPSFTTERLAGQATNALPDAPVAGTWFAAQFAQLVAHAYPPVGTPVPAPREDADAQDPVGEVSPFEAGSGDPRDGARQGGADDVDDGGRAPEVADGDDADGGSGGGVPDGGCAADLVIANDWGSGFQADVTVTAGSAIAGWQVEIALPAGTSTDGLWNGDPSASTGTITVGDVGWNGALAAGETGAFGFTATGSPPQAGPVPCVAR